MGLWLSQLKLKGGSNQELNVNTYTMMVQSSDGNLYSPMNPNNDKYYGLSHLDFCYHYKLSASKTAVTSFLRTYEWSIDKNMQGAPELTLSTNQVYDYPFSSGWQQQPDSQIVTGPSVEPSLLANSTPFNAVISSIEDILSNGTSVPLSCEVSFPTH